MEITWKIINGEGKEERAGWKVQRIRSIKSVRNRQGECKNSMGNVEAKELICMTHGHELGGGKLVGGGCRAEGDNRDNCNNIINKIYFKIKKITVSSRSFLDLPRQSGLYSSRLFEYLNKCSIWLQILGQITRWKFLLAAFCSVVLITGLVLCIHNIKETALTQGQSPELLVTSIGSEFLIWKQVTCLPTDE